MKLSPLAAAVFAACAMPWLGVAHAQTIERVRLTDNDLTCTQIYAEVQQMDTMIQLAGNSAPAAVQAAQQPAAAPAPDQSAAFAAGLASLFGGNAPVPGAAVPAGLMPTQSGIPAAALADPQVQASIARARAAGYSDAQINATLQMGAARAGYPVGAALAAQQAAPAAAAAGLGGLFGALVGGGARANPAQAAQTASLFGSFAQAAAAPAPSPAPAPALVARAPAPPPASGSGIAIQARARKDHLTSMFLSKGCKLGDIQK